ncbi:MAG TPA: glutamyl-tRNA reductase [Microthrixaceae bacterium]|nr:glutamyl-tRNA reductase [Microthrixaceae bacterium]
MSVVVIGASHRTAPLAVLEKMAVDREHLPKYLDALLARDHVSEAVIVSTCNRTEIYAVAEQFHGAYDDVRDLFSDITFLPPEAFADSLIVEWDTAAVRHLFAVAAGLDSVVIGEHEILGQVRDAWDVARNGGAAGSTLNLLFRHAIETGKRARTETAISRSVTSVSQAAVVMASDRLGGLDGRDAVVLGAGAMGQGMVSLLAEVGVREVTVVNRSAERAEQVASLAAGRAATLGSLADELVAADVAFTSTASPVPLLSVDDIAPVVARRDGRPLLIVDIAVPRDVDPVVGSIEGVDLLDMDDLRAFADRGLAERRREVPAVEAIVDAEVDRYESARTSREVAPLVTDMREWAETVRGSEVGRFATKLSTLDPNEREAVEALTRAIVAKLVHVPTTRLKDASGTLRGERLSAALRDLLDLP